MRSQRFAFPAAALTLLLVVVTAALFVFGEVGTDPV